MFALRAFSRHVKKHNLYSKFDKPFELFFSPSQTASVESSAARKLLALEETHFVMCKLCQSSNQQNKLARHVSSRIGHQLLSRFLSPSLSLLSPSLSNSLRSARCVHAWTLASAPLTHNTDILQWGLQGYHNGRSMKVILSPAHRLQKYIKSWSAAEKPAFKP